MLSKRCKYDDIIFIMRTAIKMKKINGFDASEVIKEVITSDIPLEEILDDILKIDTKEARSG